MISSVLTKVGLPIAIDIVARALARIDNPVAKNASKALGEVEKAIAGGIISPEQMQLANRHTERMAELKYKEFETSLSEINKSLRTEVASSDAYVRRMRPTFGYLMAFTWAAQMFAIAYVMIFETEKAPFVLQAMGSLSAIWAVGLSVLGIYVYKRSEDKKVWSQLIEKTPFLYSAYPDGDDTLFVNDKGLEYSD